MTLWHQEGHTALHLAAKNGHSELVRVLLEHGASKNKKDRVWFAVH